MQYLLELADGIAIGANLLRDALAMDLSLRCPEILQKHVQEIGKLLQHAEALLKQKRGGKQPVQFGADAAQIHSAMLAAQTEPVIQVSGIARVWVFWMLKREKGGLE